MDVDAESPNIDIFISYIRTTQQTLKTKQAGVSIIRDFDLPAQYIKQQKQQFVHNIDHYF